MEKQEINIKIIFKVRHEPGTEAHLQSILENYLRGKGIELKDGIIYV